QVRRDPRRASNEAARFHTFKKASCTASSARPGSPRTRSATPYASPAYRSYSPASASCPPAARAEARSASASLSPVIGSAALEQPDGDVGRRVLAAGQGANRRMPRSPDRPLLVLDQPPGPAGVLPDALTRRVQSLRHQLDAGKPGQLADLLVER